MSFYIISETRKHKQISPIFLGEVNCVIEFINFSIRQFYCGKSNTFIPI